MDSKSTMDRGLSDGTCLGCFFVGLDVGSFSIA
jgi:hypothetical protein